MTNQYEKITQLLNYFARQNSNSRIQKLKAIKLIWAADRYHMRKYGRLVSHDNYYAMNFGPVGSLSKNVAEADPFFVNEAALDYISHYIGHDGARRTVTSHRDIEEDNFSKTDLEALTFAWSNFGNFNGFQIADISHEYPEWAKLQPLISAGSKSVPIDLRDFFKDPDSLTILSDDPFELSSEILESSEETYTSLR